MDLANETNGVNGGNGHAPKLGMEDLPYFQEYLQTILRPRVEKAIESIDRLLTEAAWRHIISTIAADQHLTPETAASIVRPLLEQKLGLKLQAKLESQFGAATPATSGPGVDLGEGMTRTPGMDGADVLTVRRRPMINPIANAVASNPRPLGR